MESFIEEIKKDLLESAATKQRVAETMVAEIAQAVEMITDCLAAGGKVLLIGNGGSAADAQHIAAELVGRFSKDRRPIAAIALTTDTSILTAVANDAGYDHIFARQIAALASPNDVVIAISTSGASPNIIKGAEAARELGCRLIALTGGGGGSLASLADLCLDVPSLDTPRIQEAHITIGHIICRLTEEELFGGA